MAENPSHELTLSTYRRRTYKIIIVFSFIFSILVYIFGIYDTLRNLYHNTNIELENYILTSSYILGIYYDTTKYSYIHSLSGNLVILTFNILGYYILDIQKYFEKKI